ncbi:hypothetical protein CK203_094263 [Vitis vinifera]|uniref:Reverse transcriptase zinc-binding domain-containing protein n=1 Tax=Vitis vinifera TaxID=29760 RepID=A0A438DD40_VITVI|nr:hypothetical protein CK203_094263 [Vitis vinifera]
MWDQHSGQGDWNLVFVRDFNDWEMDMVGDLLLTLRGHRPSMEDDSVIWRQGRNGRYRVKEAYRLLDKPNAIEFPARRIWVDKVPTKVCFFAWEATWGRYQVGPPRNCKGDSYLLEGLICREEKEKDLEIHSVVYFLDGLEGEE